MGEETILTKATTKSKSLRTTVPMGIVKQFNLSEGDKLNWEIKAENGNLIIVVKPIKRWKKTLMAYEEDVKNRSFLDWIKAHTSGFKPIHRYEGVFELRDEEIVFEGKDVKEGEEIYLKIPIKNITDVYLGWDDVFTGFPLSRAGDRAYPWNKPLRLRYQSSEGERTLYFFVNFHHKYGIRTSNNKEVYERLKKFIKIA